MTEKSTIVQKQNSTTSEDYIEPKQFLCAPGII